MFGSPGTRSRSSSLSTLFSLFFLIISDNGTRGVGVCMGGGGGGGGGGAPIVPDTDNSSSVSRFWIIIPAICSRRRTSSSSRALILAKDSGFSVIVEGVGENRLRERRASLTIDALSSSVSSTSISRQSSAVKPFA